MATEEFSNKVESFSERFRKNRRLKRISAVVAICLACVATVALVIPAVTLEYAKPACGIEEHEHSDDCMELTLTCEVPEGEAHVHTPACYNPDTLELTCVKPASGHMHVVACLDEAGDLVCGQAETVHIHLPECFDANGALVCKSDAAHVHGDTCYTLVEQPATAVEGADTDGDGESVDAIDVVAATTSEYVLTCTDKATGHVHNITCLDADGNVVCNEDEEVLIEHKHGDQCYEQVIICGQEEHIHTDLCYDEISKEVMKDKERDELEAAEIDDDESSSDEPQENLTQEEIAEAADQGLLFENDDIILTFDVPEKYKDDIVLTVTELDEDAAFDDDDTADGGSVATGKIRTASTASSNDEEPEYQIDLHFQAAINGVIVEDISKLGIKGNLQMKPRVVAPIINEIDLNDVAEEAKDDIGAEVTVLQLPNESSSASISEKTSEVYDEALVTSLDDSMMVFNVVSQYASASVRKTPDPAFVVEYFGIVDTPVMSDSGNLVIIDTSGKNLPKNGVNPATQKLTLNDSGKGKTVEMGPSSKVAENDKCTIGGVTYTRIYSSRDYKYYKAPSLDYFDSVTTEGSFNLDKISVKSFDEDKGSFVEVVYDLATTDLHFTNRKESAEKEYPKASDGRAVVYALISDDSEIRLMYNPIDVDKSFDAAFYDYDISNGWIFRTATPTNYTGYNHKFSGDVFSGDTISNDFLAWAKGNPDWNDHIYTYTKESGINSSGNYNGSGTKLAFGNVNTGTNLGKLTWLNNGKKNELNKYNNNSYLGCTFGLTSALDSNGNIVYSDGINAPKLFAEGSATGKTSYDNYDLEFNRIGDTYTLKSVKKDDMNVMENDLGTFSNPTNSTGTHTDIFTNNFWPMDAASSYSAGTHDVKFGATQTFKGAQHEIRYGPITQKGNDYTFPESDDGRYHNSYFGMHYEVEFNLDDEYVGPLEYLFFGDDDLWVFLDGKLVVDIGGVHSSVGEYVNLWDYIQKGTEGTHKLSIYYTERGASGSTCYMNFTLPSVTGMTPDQKTGELIVEKDVVASAGSSALTNDVFHFTISLTDSNDVALADDYSYTRYRIDDNGTEREVESGLVLWDGAEFYLKNGEYIKLEYLPENTKYCIQEILKDNEPYDVTWSYFVDDVFQPNYVINDDDPVSRGEAPAFNGIIENNTTKYKAKCTNNVPVQLPATGGTGTQWYLIGGTIIIALALMIWMRQRAFGATKAYGASVSRRRTKFTFSETTERSKTEDEMFRKGFDRQGWRGGKY